MSDTAIDVEHLSKKFSRGEKLDSLRDFLPSLFRRTINGKAARELADKEFWALDDLSFKIRRGEAVGIIGHNGAGKSTLLKHLSGLMQPTTGRVQVNGRLSALIEVGAGFHPDLTGRENVFLNGVILGMSRAEVRRKFDEIVDFSGISEFIDMPVKRYSSGMFARLGFSVAVHMEPDILIVDEVLSVGDYAFQAKSIAKMRAVAQGGATILFVSHNLRAMADMCSRSLLLRKGRLIEDGDTSHVIRSYMEQLKANHAEKETNDVLIESVDVAGSDGKRLNFQSGERAWVDIRIRARRPVSNLSCDLYVQDTEFYSLCSTSSDRLGAPVMNLAEGERRHYRFEISLHLATGEFFLCVALYRYDINKVYDRIAPAATLFINSDVDVRGAVNLYPRVTELPAT